MVINRERVKDAWLQKTLIENKMTEIDVLSRGGQGLGVRGTPKEKYIGKD